MPQIADALGTDSRLVRGIVFGPTKSLFAVDADKVHFSDPSIKPFLQDIARSGDFFVEGRDPDPIFTQILDRKSVV